MVDSAGTLLFKMDAQEFKVLLVHPSGIYNKNKPWSIPKGLVEPGEEKEETARRETLEETGIVAPEKLIYLGESVYPNKKKRVICFAGKTDKIPVCNSWEIDQAEFILFSKAIKIINPSQVVFLDRLLKEVIP